MKLKLRGWFYLVEFDFDCGRLGSLDGMFLLDTKGKVLLDALVASEREVYFGEVLGKYSEVSGPIGPEDLTTRRLSARDAALLLRVTRKAMKPHGWATLHGYNPLQTLLDACWESEHGTEPEGFQAYLREIGVLPGSSERRSA